MRYAVSGTNDVLLDATVDATGGTGPAGDPTSLMAGRSVLGENLPTGRVLWLRSLWAHDASSAVDLIVFDGSAGDMATGSTTTCPKRLVVRCASGQLTMVDIPAPGLKFSTGCSVQKSATTASACFPPGSVGGAGYYEG